MLFSVLILFILSLVEIIGFKRPSIVYRKLNQNHNAYKHDDNDETIYLADNKQNTQPPNFVKKVKNIHQKKVETSKAEYDSLFSHFQAQGPSMDVHSFSSKTLYLGKLHSKFQDSKSDGVKMTILGYLKQNVDKLSEQDIASILIGMAHLQISWDKVKRIEGFTQRMIKISEDLSTGYVGDVFWGLASMGAKWGELPNPLKSNLVNALQKHVGNLAAHPLTSVLWSLAKIGVKWIELPAPCRKSLLTRIQSTDDFNPHQSSKLLWATGTIGLPYKELSLVTMQSFIVNVGKVSKSKVSPVSSSQMLIGVAKTGITWNQLSESLRMKIWQQFLFICESSNEGSIASAFWAMGTMGATISNQPNALPLQIILDSAAQCIDNCAAWGLCNVLWGLAKMKFRWQDLPKTFTDSTILNIVRMENQMNPLDVGTLLWSIAELDFPLDTAPRFFVESLMITIEKPILEMKPVELSKSIWGLSGSGLSYNMLTEGIRWNINIALRRLSEELSPQDVANCAYGLSILTFDIRNPQDVSFRGSQEALLTAMCRTRKKSAVATRIRDDVATLIRDDSRNEILSPKYPYYDPCNQEYDNDNMDIQELEQLRIFSHFLNVMQLVINPSMIPSELLDACSFGGRHSANISSKLHERVVEGLSTAFNSLQSNQNINIHLEVSSFGGIFPIDAAISRDGQILAFLEVDGPQHYRSDGKLRRKDQLKESMYLKKHTQSTFHRIRWDEENRLGFSLVGEELASLLVESQTQKSFFSSRRH